MKTVTRQMGRTVLAVGTVALLGLPLAAQANEVIALKHALYGAGYNVTNVRPGMDDTTRAELARFQKEHGLEATGILDSETEKALGMISVQQAAQNTGQSTTPAAPAESAPVQAGSAAQETIEEDEDGGWSLW